MNPNTVKITNPLDELFNTAPMKLEEDEYDSSTEGALAVTNLEATPEKDEEDIAVDKKIDDVYDAAMDAFNLQTQMVEVLEPRYAARNAEVAANYLSIALNAASTRARVKGDRRKQAAFVPFTNNKLNGTVVASREDIMRMLSVDGETKE
jgi:hypothetical protein